MGAARLAFLLAAALLAVGCERPKDVLEAAKAGDLRRVQAIIEKDPEAMFQKDEYGNTPAIWAILEGHNDVGIYLVRKGYPLDPTESAPFPLIMACLSRYTPGSEDMLRFLLEQGADPNAEYPKEGWLALTMAVNNGQKAKVRLLVEYGADLLRRDGRGDNAFDVADRHLRDTKNPNLDLPHGELSDPRVRAAEVKRWEEMVAHLKSLAAGRMLTAGAVFWRRSTPAFALPGDDASILFIPKGAICAIRDNSDEVHTRVKVQVAGAWHDVWVQQLPPNRWGICHHPFLTFAYLTHGTEADPDHDWPMTERALLAEGRKEAKAMTREELIVLFGEDMVD